MEKIKVEYITKDGYRDEELELEDLKSEESTEKFKWDDPEEYLILDSSFSEIQKNLSNLGIVCKKIKIASIRNWPEFKTEWKIKCFKIPFNGKVCTKLPKLYRRTCKKTIFAQVCYPSDFSDSTKKDIEECTKVAAIASVAAAIALGASGAFPVFETAFKGCLATKIGDQISKITFKVKSEKKCSPWKPV